MSAPALYENAVIGGPTVVGLSYGARIDFTVTDDFSKAEWPGVRAIRVKTLATETWLLAADLPDPYEIVVSGGGGVGGTPTGAVLPYAGASAPTGFVFCDGASLLRADYPDLFAVIGTAFGAADGTHFNVPDLRARFPVGALAGGDYDRGDIGGSETVTLTTATMPSHTHTGPSHTHTIAHTHAIDPPNTTSGNNSVTHTHAADPANTTSTGQSATHDHALTSQATASTGHVHGGGGGTLAQAISGGGVSGSGAIAGASVDHTHDVNIASFNTGNNSASHTHDVNIASFTSGAESTANSGSGGTGATGSAGSDGAHENRPPFLAVNFIILATGSGAGATVEVWY